MIWTIHPYSSLILRFKILLVVILSGEFDFRVGDTQSQLWTMNKQGEYPVTFKVGNNPITARDYE